MSTLPVNLDELSLSNTSHCKDRQTANLSCFIIVVVLVEIKEVMQLHLTTYSPCMYSQTLK